MVSNSYRKRAADVLHELRVRPELGLSAEAAKRRRDKFGDNALPSGRSRHPILLFLDRFRDVLVLVLLAAAGVSLLLGRAADAAIIGVVIVLDASLSFAQVWRTEQTLKKINRHVQPYAVVLRDGTWKKIPAKELVVGDIIEVRAGERVPADARLIEVRGLKANEALLTGEADDTSKIIRPHDKKAPISNRLNMLYLGTLIVNGAGRAVVVATGTRTEFGKIAQVLKAEASPPSPLKRKLQKAGLQIGAGIFVAVGVLFLVGLWQGQGLMETSLTAITLVVSAIPEDLTMILTIALTVGVTRILRQKGIVRSLESGETLGAATVICTDKTGTLTKGVMEAEFIDFLNMRRRSAQDLAAETGSLRPLELLMLQAVALAADARPIRDEAGTVSYVGPATSRAAAAFVERAGISQEEVRQRWKHRSGISFSSQWKYRATLHDHPALSGRYLFVAGAPEVLLARSAQALNREGDGADLTSERRVAIEHRFNRLAQQGYRLMGIAVRRNLTLVELDHHDVHELLFLGIIALRDPIRPTVSAVIQQTLAAGVDIKLVTGDHPGTAATVAREVGLPAGDVLTSSDLEHLSDSELAEAVQVTTVFARITPLDKQRIIKALQDLGEVVAMTGDGINDAVALKSADIGVAMGSGTDIAKEAADLVLLDDSFETIAAAIKEGRVLRDNVRKVIAFLLSTNMAEIAIFFVSLFLGLPLPLLPAQILWVNLVTDGTSDIALSLETPERNVMRRRPEDPAAQLIGWPLFWHILSVGLIITAAAMGLYWYLLRYNGNNLQHVRTMIFTFVSFVSLLSVWSFRSLTQSIMQRGIVGNPWIFLSAAVSAGLHFLALYWPPLQVFFDTVPLRLPDLLLVAAVALATLVIIDLRKKLFHYLWRQQNAPAYAGKA